MWALWWTSAFAAGLAPVAAGRLRTPVASVANGTKNATKPIWPLSVGLTTAAPLARRWRNPAEDPAWPRDQNRLRKFRLDRTEAEYSEALRRLSADDRPDSVAWKDNATEFHPSKGTRRSSIWWAVCNATLTNSTSGGNSSGRLLQGWPLVNKTFCEAQDLMPGNFSNVTAAALACGKNCSAIQDVGCRGQEFRLCRIGAAQHVSKVGTCLRMRARRAPQETKFWRDFCTRKAVPFRMLFPGRRCAQGKTLPGALTEVACAEKASLDPTCSKFFDLRSAAPPPAARAVECRCLPKGASCEAAADPERSVFVLA